MSTIEDMRRALADAIDGYGRNTPRSMQSKQGIMGPSDLGFCRSKAALMTKGVEQTDETPINSAQIGRASCRERV